MDPIVSVFGVRKPRRVLVLGYFSQLALYPYTARHVVNGAEANEQ